MMARLQMVVKDAATGEDVNISVEPDAHGLTIHITNLTQVFILDLSSGRAIVYRDEGDGSEPIELGAIRFIS